MSLILTNSEVRKLLSDFGTIGRDVLAKGASEAAGKLRPSEDELARVDEPAPEGEFKSREQLEEEKQRLKEAKEQAKATASQAKASADQAEAQARLYSHDERPVMNISAGAPIEYETYEEQTFSSSDSRHVIVSLCVARVSSDSALVTSRPSPMRTALRSRAA